MVGTTIVIGSNKSNTINPFGRGIYHSGPAKKISNYLENNFFVFLFSRKLIEVDHVKLLFFMISGELEYDFGSLRIFFSHLERRFDNV